MDNSVFDAECVGPRFFADVKPQNLLLVFGKSTKSFRDAAKLFPSPPSRFQPVEDIDGNTNGKEGSRRNERDTKPSAIALHKIEHTKLPEKTIGTENKKGSK